MGNISMIQPGDPPFVRARDTIAPELAATLPDDLLDTESRRLFGGPDELEVLEVRLAPDTVVSPHAHDEDEVIYVLDGSIVVGRRELGTGGAILVPKHTLYTFTVGPEGVRFVNFRARRTPRAYVSREEFLRERHSSEPG